MSPAGNRIAKGFYASQLIADENVSLGRGTSRYPIVRYRIVRSATTSSSQSRSRPTSEFSASSFPASPLSTSQLQLGSRLLESTPLRMVAPSSRILDGPRRSTYFHKPRLAHSFNINQRPNRRLIENCFSNILLSHSNAAVASGPARIVALVDAVLAKRQSEEIGHRDFVDR